MTPFIITGLPRSRTAWLARAATVYGHSSCPHEPTIQFREGGMLDFMSFWMWWTSRPEHYAGVSDHHILQLLDPIYQQVEARTLFVLRPVQDVQESLRRAGLSTRSIGKSVRLIEQYCERPHVRVIHYEELADTDAVLECLQWLMPGVPISRCRIEYLQQRHVEADLVGNALAWSDGTRELRLLP